VGHELAAMSHAVVVQENIDISTLGSPVMRVIQIVEVQTARGHTLKCPWSLEAFKAAFVHGAIDVDELEDLLADVLAHPQLARGAV